MKKVLGSLMVLALASGLVACGGDEGNDDTGIVLPDNGGGDDVRDNGGTDRGPDGNINPIDPGPGTDNNNPIDPGQGTDTNTGTDENNPQTDKGPGTDTKPPECEEDPVGSCQAFFDCQAACPQDASGQACVSECQGNMSAEGLAAYQELRTCISTYCGNVTDDAEFSACLDANCIEPYFGCFWGCDYATCGDLVGCINSCPNDNAGTPAVNEQQACVNDCWSNGQPTALMDLQNYLNCARAACETECDTGTDAECNDCWNNATDTTCASQWDKCVSYGTATCGQTVQCLNACGQDEACQQECASNMSKEARTQLNAVFTCLDTACPEGSAETCYDEAQAEGGACNDEITTCIGQPTWGTATCGQTVQCLNGCGTDTACQQNCANNMSEAANTKLQAVFTCLDTACPEGSAETCYDEAQAEGGACATQIQACIDDAA